MKKISRLVFVDLETSGLDYLQHEILEFAAIVTDLKLKEVGRFVYKITPKHIESASPDALKTFGYDADVWSKEGLPITRALSQINRLIPKKTLGVAVGHNVKMFDLPFIRKAYTDQKLFDPFSFHVIDTLDLAMAYCVASGVTLPNLKLQTLVTHFGLTCSKAHHAMYDIHANMEVFKEIVGLLRIGWLDCQGEVSEIKSA